MADLPKPSVAELDRLEDEMARLRALRARLAPDDAQGATDIDAAMAAAQRALVRQGQALELHREKTLLRNKLERLEARLTQIEEAERDPTITLRYTGGPTDARDVRSRMRQTKARLDRIIEEGSL